MAFKQDPIFQTQVKQPLELLQDLKGGHTSDMTLPLTHISWLDTLYFISITKIHGRNYAPKDERLFYPSRDIFWLKGKSWTSTIPGRVTYDVSLNNPIYLFYRNLVKIWAIY